MCLVVQIIVRKEKYYIEKETRSKMMVMMTSHHPGREGGREGERDYKTRGERDVRE